MTKHDADGDGWDEGGAEPRVFTLEEAGAVLPRVIAATAETIRRMQEAEGAWKERAARLDAVTAKRGEAEEQSMLFADWTQRVEALGAQPKGAFTVDFLAEDRETNYCWTWGEPEIGHAHKAWEGFAQRLPLSAAFAPDLEEDGLEDAEED